MLTWAKIWSVARFLILTTKLPWKNMAVVQLPFSPQNAPNSEGCAWYMRTALSTSWQRDFGSPLWSRDPRVNMFIPFQRWTQVNHRNLWADLEFRFKPGSNNHLAASQRSTQPVPKISHPTLHLRCDGHSLWVQALCRSTFRKRQGWNVLDVPTSRLPLGKFSYSSIKCSSSWKTKEAKNFSQSKWDSTATQQNSPYGPAAWTCDSRSHRSRWFSVQKKTSGFFQKNIFSFFGFQYHPYIGPSVTPVAWIFSEATFWGFGLKRVEAPLRNKKDQIYTQSGDMQGQSDPKKMYTSAMSFQHKHRSSIWILSPSRTHDLGNGIASPAPQLTFN